MNMKNKKLKFSKKIILPILLAGMVSSVGVMAKPHGCDRGHHLEQKFERLIDHLDLSKEQEKKAELIFEQLRESKSDKQTGQNRHHMMNLNPGDADYLEKVTEHANLKAEHVRSSIIQMAAAKQSLYEILDDSQKEKMSKMAERRMKKMEKRMQKKEKN
jgi:Spy/CpxP family protein refolding chaperone